MILFKNPEPNQLFGAGLCGLLMTFSRSPRDRVTPYRLGKLGNLKIHFVHYSDQEEVVSKCNRRVNRMNEITDKRYLFLIDDRDLGTPEIIQPFHKLPFPI